MNQDDRVMVTAMVVLMLFLWAGFLWHRSPEFAGSALGGVFAVSGASLMVLGSILYSVVRRIPPMRRALSRYVSMRTLLSAHVYLCMMGALLALIHTGHKYQSTLGMALTAVMLLVVLTGYIGRYLLARVGDEARDKRGLLAGMRARLDAQTVSFSSIDGSEVSDRTSSILRVIEAVADLESAIAMEDRLRTLFRSWLILHIVLSLSLYGLLALHVWSGVEFGLRWFR